MYKFWQDNHFYKAYKKANEAQLKGRMDRDNCTTKSCGDYTNLELIKLYPESEDDIYDAFNAPEDYGHRMDALKHCIENKIPFLRWNGMVYDWHQNQIKV